MTGQPDFAHLVIDYVPAETASNRHQPDRVANWWVVGVDTAGGTISLVNPAGGEVRTYSVTTAEGRAELPRVKTGDYLTAVDSLILVVSIVPKK